MLLLAMTISQRLAKLILINFAKQHRQSLAILSLITLLLSGCTSFQDYVHNGFKVGPNYAPEPTAVNKDWLDTNDPRISEEIPLNVDWWKNFQDPHLDSLIETAFRQNLTVREAGYRILIARAELGIAVGTVLPQQQFVTGQYLRTVLSKEVANRQFIGERVFDNWTMGFGLAWELDFWGKYRRAIEASDAHLEAQVASFDDAVVTLLSEVATNYVILRTEQEKLKLARQNVKIQTETFEIAKGRFLGGQTSELDVNQSKADLKATEALIPDIEVRIRRANNRLCLLMGMPPTKLQELLGNSAIPVPPTQMATGVPMELLARRPDIRVAEREAAKECARIGIAESELYPHISLTGTVGIQAENFGELFSGAAMTGTIGPNFHWNVLNYGRLLNNIKRQEAEFKAIVTNYQEKVLRAQEEVENALVLFIKTKDRVNSLRESVKAQEAAVKDAIIQYKGGLVNFNWVAVLQERLVQRQLELAAAEGVQALSMVEVYRALGGGWEIRCRPQSYPPESAETPTEIPSVLPTINLNFIP